MNILLKKTIWYINTAYSDIMILMIYDNLQVNYRDNVWLIKSIGYWDVHAFIVYIHSTEQELDI